MIFWLASANRAKGLLMRRERFTENNTIKIPVIKNNTNSNWPIQFTAAKASFLSISLINTHVTLLMEMVRYNPTTSLPAEPIYSIICWLSVRLLTPFRLSISSTCQELNANDDIRCLRMPLPSPMLDRSKPSFPTR